MVVRSDICGQSQGLGTWSEQRTMALTLFYICRLNLYSNILTASSESRGAQKSKMKYKYLTFVLTVLMSMVCSVASANDNEDDEWPTKIGGIYYDLWDGRADVMDGADAYTGNVVIPEKVTYKGETYTVMGIAEAFNGCTGLISITIPCSVNNIYDSFNDCSSLTSVTFPNSSNSDLDDLDILESFNGCTDLSVSFPNRANSGLYINDSFNGCTDLSVTFPNMAEFSDMGDSFEDCNGLTVNFNCSEIRDWFRGCTGLTSITIGNDVKSLDRWAFSGCSGLTSATIGNSVTSIDGDAFSGCSALTSVTINCTRAYNCFSGISSIRELTIGDNVEEISGGAFEHCTGLTSVIIGNSLTSIGSYAFSGCSNLTSITIPNSVTSIGSGAFEHCTGLTSVTISNSVTNIDNYTFYDCRGLTSVNIPNSVTSIGRDAFCDCSGLTSVTIPNSVTSIGEGAFSGCRGLTTVTIPNSVTSICADAFQGCSSLNALIFDDGNETLSIEQPFYSFEEPFDDCPFGSLYLGRNISYEEEHPPFSALTALSTLTIGNCVTSIGNKMFQYCSGLTSVTIGDNVTAIGENAFSNCSGLTSVTIGNRVIRIGGGAFFNCSGLTSITIPNSVTSIELQAFGGCTGLTSIEIPNSVTSIVGTAFSGCIALESIVVKEGNTKYDSRENCNAIIETESDKLIIGCKNTIIPESVKAIGSYAFEGHSGLTSIYIPYDVTTIGNNAFRGCTNLTYVTLGENLETIGDFAFVGCTSLKRFDSRAQTPPSCTEKAYIIGTSSYIEDCTLEVPIGCIEVYQSSIPWDRFANIVEKEEFVDVYLSTECGTFCSDKPLDFTKVKGIKAYIASFYDKDNGVLILTRVNKVKPCTGLVLYGKAGETYEVPVCTGSRMMKNFLVGIVIDTELNPTEGEYTNLILAKDDDSKGYSFYGMASSGTLKASKAYLKLRTDELPTEVKGFRMMFDDGDMSDGVETIHNEQFTIHNEADAVYDLQGRRVAKPTKGIYIVNGKKTVIK